MVSGRSVGCFVRSLRPFFAIDSVGYSARARHLLPASCAFATTGRVDVCVFCRLSRLPDRSVTERLRRVRHARRLAPSPARPVAHHLGRPIGRRTARAEKTRARMDRGVLRRRAPARFHFASTLERPAAVRHRPFDGRILFRSSFPGPCQLWTYSLLWIRLYASFRGSDRSPSAIMQGYLVRLACVASS